MYLLHLLRLRRNSIEFIRLSRNTLLRSFLPQFRLSFIQAQ